MWIIWFVIFIFIFLFVQKMINKKKSNCFNIAHGCGMIDSIRYTNSLESFYKSYKIGYRYIEIDLLTVEDKHIIGAHDLVRFKILTNFSDKDTLNYEYIKKAKILNKYHVIYNEMIYGLLKKYKDVKIFTDKITNYILLKKYLKKLNRIYVEVFTKNQYNEAKRLGFINVMLNIRTGYDLKNLIFDKNTSIEAITIGPSIFYKFKSYLTVIFKKNIKIFAFLIQNNTDISSSFCKYVNGFYID